MHTDAHSPTRLAILHAATVMFADRGVEHTTTDQLIHAANCSTGTFYRCVGRMENVPPAAYQYVQEIFTRAANKWPAEFTGTEDARYDALLGRWLGVAHQAMQEPRYFYFWQQYRCSPAGRARVQEVGWVLGPFHDDVAPMLAQLLKPVPNPLVPQPVSAELAAALWTGQWAATMAYGRTLPVAAPRTADHVLEESFRAWWTALQSWPLPAPRSAG